MKMTIEEGDEMSALVPLAIAINLEGTEVAVEEAKVGFEGAEVGFEKPEVALSSP